MMLRSYMMLRSSIILGSSMILAHWTSQLRRRRGEDCGAAPTVDTAALTVDPPTDELILSQFVAFCLDLGLICCVLP